MLIGENIQKIYSARNTLTGSVGFFYLFSSVYVTRFHSFISKQVEVLPGKLLIVS